MTGAIPHTMNQTIPEITPQDLKSHLSSVVVIDVRRPDEFIGELGHIHGAKLFTLETDFAALVPTLTADKNYVFVCRSGGRSANATRLAMDGGVKSVYNLKGGMLAWNALEYEVEKS